MHINTGYQRDALPLIGRHVEVFEPYEAIVAPSGSCVACVRHQRAMVAPAAGKERLNKRAAGVAGRTYELSEFLVDVLGVEDVGASYPHRVTYHPTCHSLRLLRVGDRPLRLLWQVRGLDLVELPAAWAMAKPARWARTTSGDIPRVVGARAGSDVTARDEVLARIRRALGPARHQHPSATSDIELQRV